MEKEALLLRYFGGVLSKEDQVLFDQFLENDPDFNSQFEFEKNVRSVINDWERNTLKQKLQNFELERKIDLPVVDLPAKNRFWKPLRIAAAIAILLGASWFVFYSNSFTGTENLYASNYEAYPNTVYTITRGDSADTSLERKAFEAYESEKYEAAITYFEELQAETGLDYVDFYLAQSYLANGDEEKAIEAFSKIRVINSDYNTEAIWYEALALLKLKKNKEAIPLLQMLTEKSTYKDMEAQKLLKKLE